MSNDKPEPKKLTKPDPDFLSFKDVLREELEDLRPGLINDTQDSGKESHEFDKAHDANLVGLALSGGGIRSATFNLGILQALAKDFKTTPGLLPIFDYLSTVSGGGYIGCWFSAWLHREKASSQKDIEGLQSRLSTRPCGFGAAPEVETECSDQSGIDKPRTSGFPPLEHAAIRHLRRFSNYLSPRLGISGDLLAVISLFLRNLVVLQLGLITLVVSVLLVPYWITSISVFAIDPDTETAALSWALFALGFIPLIFALRIWRWQFKDPPQVPDDESKRKGWRAELRRNQKSTNWWMAFSVGLLPFAFWLIITSLVPTLVELTRLNGEVPRIFVLVYTAVYLFAWFISPGSMVSATVAGDSTRTVLIKRSIIALAAGVIFGFLVHFCAVFLDVSLFSARGHRAFLTVVGAPAMLMLTSFSIAIQLGLGRNLYQERERERWARVGGLVLLAAAAWLLVFGVALYAPPLVNWLGGGGLAAVVTWASASGLGAWIARTAIGSNAKGQIPWSAIISRTVPWFFLFGLAIFVSYGVSVLVRAVSLGYQVGSLTFSSDLPVNVAVGVYTLLFEYVSISTASVMLASAFALFLVISWRLDLNIFSAHAIYKNRLVRAYLGASNLKDRNPHPFSGFDPDDDMQLSDLEGQRPIPIINATINMTGGDDLAWQTRRAASFTFTPQSVGFEAKSSKGVDLGGYRNLAEYSTCETFTEKENTDNDKDGISLGTALAISGAAASPNMGQFTSPALAALLTVFNLRTGFWAGNPAQLTEDGKSGRITFPKIVPAWKRKRPLFSAWPLIAELAGSANAESNWVSLSDGGHFENLAIYELVRRRCRFIIATDAGCDPNHEFQDLANTIRKCWTDFGVHINFPDIKNVSITPDADRISEQHGSLGLIEYPDRARPEESGEDSDYERYGLILYLKCSLTQYEIDNYIDIRQYAKSHGDFPHESTSDQFFDENQFEAYRHLGYSIAQHHRSIIEELVDQDRTGLNKAAVLARVKEFRGLES